MTPYFVNNTYMLTSFCISVHSYSRPAGLSIFLRFRYPSVLTNVQNHCRYPLALPVLQGGTHVSFSSLSLAASSQQPAYRSAGFSSSVTSCTMTTRLPISCSSSTVSLHPVLKSFLYTLNVYIRSCFRIIGNHFFVFRFMNSSEQLHAIFVDLYFVRGRTRLCLLLKAGMYRSLMLSHDFVAHIRRISEQMVDHFPLLSIQRKLTFARRYRRLHRYTALTRFRFGRRNIKVRHYLNSRSVHTVEPTRIPKLLHPSSKRAVSVRGGGRKLLSWSSVEQLVFSMPDSMKTRDKLAYAGHVDPRCLQSFPADKYVYTRMPLSTLVDLLTLADARPIVSLHGVAAGSRGSAALLKGYVADHTCDKCTQYVTVFSIGKNATETRNDCVVKNRNKKVTDVKCSQQLCANLETTVPFPPKPASNELELDIIKKACSRMNPDNFEEVGCAVCGELKPRKDSSRLKGIKNMLHILEAPGVTRTERKTDKCPVKEYKGPVLDYSCSQVCKGCRADLHNSKVPRLALARNLWLGPVPDVLKKLTFVEKILIARVRHTCAFVKVASGMRKMKANIIAFESPIQKIYNILPPPREDIDDVLAILFTGPCKPTAEDFARTPFLVRRNAVITALEWLRLNHIDYADIQISHENAMQYEEDMPPVSIEYQKFDTNKVPEGTSVFDHEEEEGTVEGDCVFTVHGLTGETLNSMTPNAVKAMALKHLNSGGKMLAVGHSDRFESMWNNPHLYPQMFPWLFPYGLGGIGASSISHKEHKRHLLMYHDKRFQVDINFPFVAFSHEQVRASTTQSFLLADQSRFTDISERLMSIDWTTLSELISRMEAGEHVDPTTDSEKGCFKIIQDLDAVSVKMHGTSTSKKFMRNEIWSLVNHLGAPSWYITLSPADLQHPICIYFADTKERFYPTLPSYDDRARLVCENPVAGARFFDFMVTMFLTDVLGIQADNREGFYGPTSGYYGTVEQQGRLTLHLHMLLWIAGNLNPEDIRSKILGDDSEWRKSLVSWLERCHSGDFITGIHEEISNRCEELKTKADYVDPTQTLPVPPPSLCNIHAIPQDDCCRCDKFQKWNTDYQLTTDHLLLRSNVHSCNRGTRKDGTRKKNTTYAACMDNRFGKCKARFPRLTAHETTIDETGAVSMKKREPWLNTFTPVVTYLLRCNTDVTSLASGTAIKAVIMYVSDYITKTTLKTHVIFDSIRSVFQKNGEMMGGSLPRKEKARRFMTKVANLLSAKAEMGAPMISMYLLGNPDHYTDHSFISFYWQQYVREVQRDFTDADLAVPQKVTIIKKKGRIVGLSPVHDYIHRPQEAESICLYDWIRCYKREKMRKRKVDKDDERDVSQPADVLDNSIALEVNNPDLLESGTESESDDAKICGRSNALRRFKAEHPLSDSHGARYIKDNLRRVPTFLGANLPRCDQGDREYYCTTMLTLFKPWRSGTDLRNADNTWDTAFNEFNFTETQRRYIRNFNVKYECLDARDDYRAQMKKDITVTGSWEDSDNLELDDEFHGINGPSDLQFDDTPCQPLKSGPINNKRAQEMNYVKWLMSRTGWTDAIDDIKDLLTSFKPDVFKNGSAWEQEIETAKNRILDEKNKNRLASTKENKGVDSKACGKHIPNVVKVVDKSYLDKDFRIDKLSDLVELTAKDYSLNKAQERAFRIIANHAISDNPEQLCMYLGGMGGTGKTQVIKALTHFFTKQKEAHRFIVVAPTGTAAALLGGSTYHSMFGINDRNATCKIGQVKARLEGAQYVFLDEVSMLSARDLYRINLQLAKVFEIADVPFGGLNMVFSGDFAQLPPAVGGEHVSLYSRRIGTTATDMRSQEESVGKALWHQITTVVILRENMRQRRQSADDAKLRTALENLRYKACTPDDIAFLRTRISSSVPGRPSVCDKMFRNVSIITGTNIQKDEINQLGALRFAQETGQDLTDFFSEDSSRVTQTDASDARGVKRVGQLTKDMMEGFWSQPPSSTDKHIAGKLSLCIGLPVMIRFNYATELCMTRGQEGFVHGWQSKIGSQGQNVLDTLFVKLKDPPSSVLIPGLPENVVPVFPTTTNVNAMLPNDEKFSIARTQVEVLVNFAMTDFASQGKTRPFNVSDLNNLRSHQAYYTALSRSATADGTLILQGFDSKHTTGGCSGALRQEFRELELLDEITRLRYVGKLPANVSGNTRNDLIASFRSWKGNQYVPSTVHRSIRWSTRNAWLESEALSLEERLKLLEKAREKQNKKKAPKKSLKHNGKDVAPFSKPSVESPAVASDVSELGIGKPTAQKRRRSSGMSRIISTSATHVSSKRKLHPSNAHNRRHYTTPIGLRWSQNSCAYDAVFTSVFIHWCTHRLLLTEEIRKWGSPAANQLIDGFIRYDAGLETLEDARDAVRHAMARTHRLEYGAYTSIENVCGILFRMNNITIKRFFDCPNGHHGHLSDDYDALLSLHTSSFTSIAHWVSSQTDQPTVRCRVCRHAASVFLEFCSAPPLFAFEFSAHPTLVLDNIFKVQIGNRTVSYTLSAIIYYSQSHFTSQIITRDGRVWFYDGMSLTNPTVDPTLEYISSINSPLFTKQICRDAQSCAAIYSLI